MNILLVTPWRLSATGGITTIVVRLATEFAKKGHAVTVFTLEGENRLREIEVVGEIPVFGMYLRSPVIQGASVRAWIAWCLFFPLTLWRLHRFLNRRRIEGVIVQYPLPAMAYFGVLRRLSAWKLIVAYQGNDAHDLMLWTAVERRLVQSVLSAADSVVGVSKTLLEKAAAAFPLLKLRGGVVMPNGRVVKIRMTMCADAKFMSFALGIKSPSPRNRFEIRPVGRFRLDMVLHKSHKKDASIEKYFMTFFQEYS
jgi:hypothetical protein